MKFTQVAADTFAKLQLNAGVLLTEFDPDAGTLDRSKIFGATGGGVNFTAAPEYVDFGEDIDNVPANTKELKKLDSVTATMSGTFKAADTHLAKVLIGAADIVGNKVVPRVDLLDDDFIDVWWVGDYSDDNSDTDGGFIAIKLINALSTGGFAIQSNNKSKGDFAFTFTGHFSMADINVLPYELYIKPGGGSGYTYTAVTPVGTENPSQEGWYELSGTIYTLTTDTTVDSEKTYYERS